MNDFQQCALTVVMRTDGKQAPTDPDFVKATRAAVEAFETRFANRTESLRVNPGPFNRPDQAWVGTFDAVLLDPNVIWEVHAWLVSEVRPTVPDSYASIRAPNDPKSIVHSRWVKLESDWYNVEAGPQYETPPNLYPPLCDACGWPDLDQVPDPFFLDKCVLKAGSREFFHAGNGVLVATARVRDLFASVAPDQFTSGAVTVRGKKQPDNPLYWMRPLHRIGGYVKQQRQGESCSSCGRPQGFVTLVNALHQPAGLLVEDFGERDWNLALVGQHPTHADRTEFGKVPVQHDVVIAGGLFAVLYNQKVKGLRWPEMGSYISRRSGDLIWEPARRFGDRTPPGDAIMKHK